MSQPPRQPDPMSTGREIAERLNQGGRVGAVAFQMPHWGQAPGAIGGCDEKRATS